MNSPSATFRFRKGVTVGALAAEQDVSFLKECFVDTGIVATLLDMNDHRRVLRGRTGSGKSALFIRLSDRAETITISPDELALDHLSNSAFLQQLHDCGISLMPLYKLLWKHVFVVEVLRVRHEQLRDSARAQSFWRNLLASLSGSAKDETNKEALEYLSQFGEKFWLTTEYRVKEVTARVEQQIEAKIGVKFGGSLDLSKGGVLLEEQKGALRQIGKDFVEAIQIKKLNEAVKWLAKDIEGQPPLFVIIDGLDENWADRPLRYQLIRALIDTAKELKVVGNVKILIALRNDLFEAVLDHTSEPGFQREKHNQLCLDLIWSRGELHDLIEKRVNKVIREAYTTSKVKIDDLMEKVGGAPGIQYLIDRTLLRPRDLISFFNQCLLQTGDNPRITRQMILAAEKPYSDGRLDALADEWRAVEPLVAQAASLLLRARKAVFRLRDISAEEIHHACEELYVGHWNQESRFREAAKRHCERPMECSPESVRRLFIDFFYKIGLVGVKLMPQERVQWSTENATATDIRSHELSENCAISVHKAFWRALSIISTGGTPED